LGLGGLFVLFMVYSYVITPPAVVKIGSESLGPGEIDPYTVDKVATQLQSAMNNNAKIVMAVPKYVQSFQDAMAWKNAPALAMGNPYNTIIQDVQLPSTPNQPQQPIAGPNGVPIPANMAKVIDLPIPPTPAYVDVRFGRSVILPPPAPGQPRSE